MASIPFSPVAALSQGTFFVIALTMINISSCLIRMGAGIFVIFDLNQSKPSINKVYWRSIEGFTGLMGFFSPATRYP